MTTSTATSNSSRHNNQAHTASMSELKILYKESLSQLQDIFPDWNEEDLAMALSEHDGDIVSVIHRISEGHIIPWSEQGKKFFKKDPFKRSIQRERRRIPTGKYQQRQYPTEKRNVESKIYFRPSNNEMTKNEVTSPVNDRSTTKETSENPKPSSMVLGIGHRDPLEDIHDDNDLKDSAKQSRVMKYRSIRGQNIGSISTPMAEVSHPELPRSETPINDDPKTDNYTENISSLLNRIVEDDVVNFQDLPVVKMPNSLSSRISTASLVQPVVVMPLRATVRPGLSVNFGVSTQPPYQYSTGIIEDSPRSFDEIIGPLKQGQTLVHRNTGVEAGIEAFVGKEVISNVNMNRKHQPIQRPAVRENYLSSPPGLRAEENSSTRELAPAKGSAMFASNTKLQYTTDEEVDSAPGLSSYYPQQQVQQNRHHHHNQYQTTGNSTYSPRAFDQLVNHRPNDDISNTQLNNRHIQPVPWSPYMASSQGQNQHHAVPANYYTNYSQQFYSDPSVNNYHPIHSHQSHPNYGSRRNNGAMVTSQSPQTTASYIPSFTPHNPYSGVHFYANPLNYSDGQSSGHGPLHQIPSYSPPKNL